MELLLLFVGVGFGMLCTFVQATEADVIGSRLFYEVFMDEDSVGIFRNMQESNPSTNRLHMRTGSDRCSNENHDRQLPVSKKP